MRSCRGTIASMLQPKVLRTNDSSHAVLNNNQILYNNREQQQESGSNDSQSETLQMFQNLNSMGNVNVFPGTFLCILGINYAMLMP